MIKTKNWQREYFGKREVFWNRLQEELPSQLCQPSSAVHCFSLSKIFFYLIQEMPPKSWIWKHISVEDDKKFKCSRCAKKFGEKTGNSSLQYHLEKTHNLHATLSTEPSASTSSCRDSSGRNVAASSSHKKGTAGISAQGQSSIAEWTSAVRPCSQSRAKTLTKMIVNCAVKDLLPLSFCEDEGMAALMVFMEPNYQPPVHKTVQHHLMKLYEEKRAELMELYKGKEVSITVDGWTNSQMVGFFSVMAHMITDDWVMKSFNVASPEIEGSHTGDNLAGIIESTIEEWDLKCFACVHDTAANMNCALKKTNKVECDFGCLAHILQLAIKDALKQSADDAMLLIRRVRDVVKYARKSEKFSREIRKFRDRVLPGWFIHFYFKNIYEH